MNIKEIAKLAYNITMEINLRSTCLDSMKWKELDLVKRDNFIFAADFYLHNPAAGPREHHDHCFNFKKALGWVYGNAYSEISRTDPKQVPYSGIKGRDKVTGEMFAIVVNELRVLYVTKHESMEVK